VYQVYLADHFLRQLKFYLKKHRHIDEDLVITLKNFRPEIADRLGQKLYKLRMKSRDIPKGKNKSFRLIVFLAEINAVIIPITLYFKGERSDILEKEIEYHLAMVLEDVRKQNYLTK
jgi:mRNA-degrading endonuclease RelE of RelBE toxin-antitoxin system